MNICSKEDQKAATTGAKIPGRGMRHLYGVRRGGIPAGSRPGNLVLDPCLGSGTTALVAKQLGRFYVGVELNSDSVRMAEERLVSVPLSL